MKLANHEVIEKELIYQMVEKTNVDTAKDYFMFEGKMPGELYVYSLKRQKELSKEEADKIKLKHFSNLFGVEGVLVLRNKASRADIINDIVQEKNLSHIKITKTKKSAFKYKISLSYLYLSYIKGKVVVKHRTLDSIIINLHTRKIKSKADLRYSKLVIFEILKDVGFIDNTRLFDYLSRDEEHYSFMYIEKINLDEILLNKKIRNTNVYDWFFYKNLYIVFPTIDDVIPFKEIKNRFNLSNEELYVLNAAMPEFDFDQLESLSHEWLISEFLPAVSAFLKDYSDESILKRQSAIEYVLNNLQVHYLPYKSELLNLLQKYMVFDAIGLDDELPMDALSKENFIFNQNIEFFQYLVTNEAISKDQLLIFLNYVLDYDLRAFNILTTPLEGINDLIHDLKNNKELDINEELFQKVKGFFKEESNFLTEEIIKTSNYFLENLIKSKNNKSDINGLLSFIYVLQMSESSLNRRLIGHFKPSVLISVMNLIILLYNVTEKFNLNNNPMIFFENLIKDVFIRRNVHYIVDTKFIYNAEEFLDLYNNIFKQITNIQKEFKYTLFDDCAYNMSTELMNRVYYNPIINKKKVINNGSLQSISVFEKLIYTGQLELLLLDENTKLLIDKNNNIYILTKNTLGVTIKKEVKI